jgi:hypothetical protein
MRCPNSLITSAATIVLIMIATNVRPSKEGYAPTKYYLILSAWKRKVVTQVEEHQATAEMSKFFECIHHCHHCLDCNCYHNMTLEAGMCLTTYYLGQVHVK